jgi:hypothetical protein
MKAKVSVWLCLGVLLVAGGCAWFSREPPEEFAPEEDYRGASPKTGEYVIVHGKRGWFPLFDGRTTKGWTSPSGSVWTVSGGVLSPPEGKTGLLVSEETFSDFKFTLEFLISEPEGELAVVTTCDARGKPRWTSQAAPCSENRGFRRRGVWCRFDAMYQDGCVVCEGFYGLDGSLLGSPRSMAAPLADRPYPGHIALVGKGVKVRNIKLKPMKPLRFRVGSFWDKYQKVKLGMTREDVKGILGPETDHSDGPRGPWLLEWHEGERTILVYFDDAEGRATGKNFRPDRSSSACVVEYAERSP